MTRAQFVKVYADLVAAGRKRNFPDVRPSEAAFMRMDDEKSARSQWKKHSRYWRAMTVAQATSVLAGDSSTPVNHRAATLHRDQ